MKPRLCLESRIALLVGAVLGGLAVWFVPPAITFDGPSHAFRALQVSEGRMRAERTSDRAVGGTLPAGHVAFVRALWTSYWTRADFGTLSNWSALSQEASALPGRTRVEFTNTAVYSPANYAFQATGMALSARITRSPLAAHRLGCLFNLTGYLGVIVAALELLPRFRRGFLLLALSPLVVIQAASLSADAVNVSLPLLVLAAVWHLRSGGPTEIRPREAAAVLGLGLVVALLKPTAVASLVCLAFIPARHFGSRLSKAAALSGAFLCAAAVWLAWNRANLDVDVAGWFEPGRPPLGVQKQWFLGDPRRFLQPFGYLLAFDLAPQWAPMYGGVGGWIPPWIASGLKVLSLAFLAGLLGCGSWEGRPDWAWAAGNLLQSLALTVLIALTLWLSMGTVEMDHIPAFSGRYLLPIVAGCAVAWAEAFHTGLPRLRSGLFWLALGANCAGLTAIVASLALRTA